MGTLQVVATPIGNLEDVTLRALRVLGEADLVLAEDTRRTRTLLARHEIVAPLRSLHAHNEMSRIESALEVLAKDGSVALVSDAGTPLVSDPGERLLAAVVEAGHRVEAIPGPSAVLAALAVSGLRVQPFTFLGFLPRRKGPRAAVLDAFRDRSETLVLFESPRRVVRTLHELIDVLGDRRACVARELTKIHEEARRGLLSELADHYREAARGEFTLVVAGVEGGVNRDAIDDVEVDARIRSRLAAGARPKEIAAELAVATARPKRELYARALRARETSGEASEEG